MSKNWLALAGIVFLVLTIFGFLGYRSYQTHLQPGLIAEATLTGNIDLQIVSPVAYLTPNAPNTLTIDINSLGQATGVSAEISYDPAKLEVISVTKGDFFSTTLAAAKIENGLISFTYAVSPDSGGKQGEGTVATIVVKPLSAGPVDFAFTSNTIATALEYETTALRTLMQPVLVARLAADLNADGAVNLLDYNLFVPDYGYSQTPVAGPADINADGTVDLLDYNLFVAAYGQTN